MKKIDSIKNSKGQRVTFENFKDDYYNFEPITKNTKNYLLEAKSKLEKRLCNISKDVNDKNYTPKIEFLKYLIKDFKKIVTALPTEIDTIIGEIKKIEKTNVINDNDDYKKFYELILADFNYKGFRSSTQLEWFGKCFNIKSCLYCNSQFTIIVSNNSNKRSKLLFQIDHFYNKETYPYLSLTLGNLIPSCSSCNIRKGKKSFSVTNNIHPFIEDLNSCFEFKVSESEILDKVLVGTNFNGTRLDWDIKPNYSPSEKIKLKGKVKLHFEEFNLKNIYDAHSDIVEELIMKGLHYNESHKNELINTFKGLNIDENLIDRFILGNYTLDEDINLRPLSKLSKDIAKQLRLIK